MKKKILCLLLCLVILVPVLQGCGKQEETPATTETKEETTQKETTSGDNTFTYAIGGDTGNTLNPLTADDRYGLMTCHLLYSPAYHINADGSVQYIIAESMEASEDGLSYTMKIKEGLKWTDGTDLTVEDIIFSYDSINEQGQNLYIDGKPIAVEKVDDTTVKFVLPAVSASAFEMISSEVSILPKHFFEGRGSFDINMLEEEVIGSGPYMLDEYVTGQHLKFVKNPNYGDGPANIDTIIFKIIEKNDTATLALQNGEIDAWIATPDMLDPYEGNDAFTITNYSEGRVAYLRLNPNTEAMKDKTYRQGILHALNRDEIMMAAYSDAEFYNLGYSFLPFTNQYYTEDVEKWEQDLAKAEELTANGPKTLTVCYVEEDAVQTNMALTIQAQLSAIGITAELSPVNWAGYLGVVYDSKDTKHDIFLGGYVMGVDPYMYSSLFMTSKDNMMMFSSQEVDDLFTKGNSTLDEGERTEVYGQLQKVISEEAIFYPFGTNLRTLVTSARIGGLEDAKFAPVYTFGDYSKLKIE